MKHPLLIPRMPRYGVDFEATTRDLITMEKGTAFEPFSDASNTG